MRETRSWIYDLLLIAVLVAAAAFRIVGLDWDDNHHLHPDERFLTMVESGLQVKKCTEPGLSVEQCPEDQKAWIGLSDYFNTATSTLNPHNRGYGFFVYGTLPIFIVRYIAEWLGQTGYDQVHLVGRQVSAIADLGTILLLYLIAARLYGRKVALLAAAFSAFAVMQIQQSHFFTTDNPLVFFMFLALYFAVQIAMGTGRESENGNRESGVESRESGEEASSDSQITTPELRFSDYALRFLRDPLLWLSLAFGFALGMAAASKINAVVLAVMLPAALAIRFTRSTVHGSRSVDWSLIITCLVAGGFATVLAFRIFQPYAFSGPGFFGLAPNEAWINNLRDLSAQASGDADLPFALQWARRSHLYSGTNLTVYGLGLPLGILAWAGFLFMGWKILRGEWRQHLLLWAWTAAYFGWQSLQFNPTMRYQLPVYPLLAMMAAWVVFQVAGLNLKLKVRRGGEPSTFNLQPVAILIGGGVLVATILWALAFVQIYLRTHTRVAAAEWIYANLPGPINLQIDTGNSVFQQPIPFPYGMAVQHDAPHLLSFVAKHSGTLAEIYFPHVLSVPVSAQTFSLSLALTPDAPPEAVLATAALTDEFAPRGDPRGEGYSLVLDRPVMLTEGGTYFLKLETTAALTLAGATPINESSWDDGLPMPLQGYDGFGGIYNGNLNLELYWDDNADKLTRFVTTLDQGDAIFITSNRQWASITRVPERYPLSTEYYRLLVGCPEDKDIIWCYNVARPGMFEGQLGYELTAVFESYPTLEIPGLFKWEFNDQFAEEAFTVYDHPKVLIFEKSADFDAAEVQALLGAVDLTHVVHLTPRAANSYQFKDLLLPPDRLAQQQAGGTWSDLFDYEWVQNKYPYFGLLVWYLFVFVLGLFTYPIIRRVLPGLADKGYPLARALGLVILAYVPWLLGSLGVAYSRASIAAVFAAILLVGARQAWVQKDALASEWKSNRRYFLMVEGLFLAFFVVDLLIRLGNPDLWHPSKGGERPMDFSYFNAVLRSTTFPPYDPWYAGGYINYYYYGFVLVGTPVKLLGLVPTIAFNFILPTWFALVGIGAFSVGWNLFAGSRLKVEGLEDEHHQPSTINHQLIAGLAAAALMILLGNLGTVQMLYQGFQRMAAPGGIITDANFFQRLAWFVQGVGKSLSGEVLPFGYGDWYWNPSRVIPPGPGNEITEFPLFTFLYSDLHAHMIVMPVTLFVVAWALSFVFHLRGEQKNGRGLASLLSSLLMPLIFGALVLGAIYPTNTWDTFTYLPLAALATGYALFRYLPLTEKQFGLPPIIQRIGLTLAGMAALAVLSRLFYQPFFHWFGQGYSQVDPWTASHTPVSSYLTHWGLFLFVLFFWMAWETREWMASTPLSHLKKLRPYQLVIELLIAASFIALFYLLYKEVGIGVIALPMAIWAGVLVLRPGLSDSRRAVLFLIGTGLTLTIVVELVALVGDIGRMNTIFKIYLQAWTLLAVSAGAAFAWTLMDVARWSRRWRNVWQTGLSVLLACAALFSVSATADKVRDRMTPTAPHSLDSMAYMETSLLWDSVNMDIGQDYRAIRWLQDNAQGSPVIVEANLPEYRWGTRYTIYTGLPNVLGWNWHQRQQRALIPPNLITDRITEIQDFYTTLDLAAAKAFLEKYNVRYIIVGQLEQIYYPGAGLEKFPLQNGVLWREVFRDNQTAIYEVMR